MVTARPKSLVALAVLFELWATSITDLSRILGGTSGLLGQYEVITRRWSALSRRSDGKREGGFAPSQKHLGPERVNVENQRKFAEQWIAWKKNLRVIEDNRR